MDNEIDLRTLCKRCTDDYRLAGYCLVLNGYEQTKRPCDKCDRLGYEYIIKKEIDKDAKQTITAM